MVLHKRLERIGLVFVSFFAIGDAAFAQASVDAPTPSMSLPVPVIVAPTPNSPDADTKEPVSVPPPSTTLDSVRAEMLTKDLADLAQMLTGRWDNELQTFFEPELNVPAAQRHDRLHVVLRPLEASPFGLFSFYVEYRSGGETGPIVRQRIWALSLDSQLAALRLATFAPKDGKSIEGAWRNTTALASLKAADFTPVAGCDIIWRRRADGFSGETRPGACKLTTLGAGQRIITVTERHDLSANAWDVRDIGVDDRGTRVFGSADTTPTRLRRATTFVCWAGSLRRAEAVTATDLIVHDQGGVAVATLAGATPNSISIRLRNVDWPIGQNRPSLTLYVMTGTDTKAKAYAWSEPDANRIALDIGGTQASCTRDERAIWR